MLNTKLDEIIVAVTEEAYQADLAQGLEDDEVLKPGQHRFVRGGFLARHGIKQTSVPAKVSIRLEIIDGDVIERDKYGFPSG